MKFSNTFIIEFMADNNQFVSKRVVIEAITDLTYHYESGSCSRSDFERIMQKLQSILSRL